MCWRGLFARFSLAVIVMLLMLVGKAPVALAKGMLNPQEMAIDDQHGHLFVADWRNTVTEYDTRTGQPLRSFLLSGSQLFPMIVAIYPRAHRLYVGSRIGDPDSPSRLSVVDTTTGHIVRAFPTGPNLVTIALDQRLRRVYVLCSGLSDATGGTVLLMDARRDLLLKTVRIRDYLQDAVVDEGADHLFVGGMHAIYMLDARSGRLLHTLPLRTNDPSLLAIDARIRRVFASDGNRVLVLDSRTGATLGAATLGRDMYVSALAVDPVSGHLLATSYSQTATTGKLSILDVTSGVLLRQVGVGHFPTAVAVFPALDRVVVVNPAFTAGSRGQIVGDSELHIVQESTGRVLVAEEANAENMAVSAQTGHIYLADINRLLTIVDARTGKVLF